MIRSDPEITDGYSIDQFPIKCSSNSNFDSCVNITEDELGAGSVEIVFENGVVTSIRTVPFPYRLLSKNFMVQSSTYSAGQSKVGILDSLPREPRVR